MNPEMITMKIPARFKEGMEGALKTLLADEEYLRLQQHFVDRAVDFWKDHATFITYQIGISRCTEKWPGEAGFKWVQLVWQEIDMFAMLTKPVPKPDFEGICERRGFNETQKEFIKDAIDYIGLGWSETAPVEMICCGDKIVDCGCKAAKKEDSTG